MTTRDSDDEFWDPEAWRKVGEMKLRCPECDLLIPVDVQMQVVGTEFGCRPDLTDVWAHAFEHEEAHRGDS